VNIFEDLQAEYERIDAILSSLRPDQWAHPSAAPGWSIADTVLHLAQTEESIPTTIRAGTSRWTERDAALDEVVAGWVDAERNGTADVLSRWRASTTASVSVLREADPTVAVAWAAAPLRPRTLATTRLAEHWAHLLDICEPLGIAHPDTDRLHHIAWLAHATLPYAFSLHGHEPQPVRAVLDSPSGDTWTFGPLDAPSIIEGSASVFCRVGAQRLDPLSCGLRLAGPHALTACSVLRNYAA
jgi:uncharacterized protein (TIGR03084 family)